MLYPRSASNMIPCFPANNSTDVHHYVVSNRSSPSHFTNDTPLLISKVRTRSTTKKLNHCLENQKGYYLRNRNTGKCRQSKNNSSRCSIFGNNGKIDSLSDSDDFSEEVIYSHKSPKIYEIIKDFDRELNRFVEYRPPFTRKETLSIKKSI